MEIAIIAIKSFLSSKLFSEIWPSRQIREAKNCCAVSVSLLNSKLKTSDSTMIVWYILDLYLGT